VDHSIQSKGDANVPTIAEQSAGISAGASTHLPADIAQVFTDEQRAWREQGAPSGVIAVGDRLEDFTLVDATGAAVTLSELVANGPAVIVFYRGGWCPYCNLALRTYQTELLPQLDQYGARLVAISPQSPDQSLTTAEKAELKFTVLSDAGAQLARNVGIAFQPTENVLAAQRKLGLDLKHVNDSDSPELPMPTVLIVDTGHTVRFVDAHADYTARTEVAAIINALDGPDRA
jgi:peroxiredoxin